MGAVFPGVFESVQPQVATQVQTVQRVNAISGGSRVLAIVGEGETEERLVVQATGGGADGWNADYSGTSSPDGRHFQISKTSLVPNRTRILKNGIPLAVIEGNITNTAFDNRYGARVDPITGRVELQSSHLVDFGTDVLGNTLYYSRNSSNVGTGTVTVSQADLLDINAPNELWTARVVGVIKDGSANTIPGEATITVTGSTSGQILDASGNPIVWKSDGVAVDNGILSLTFTEGGTPFAIGDRFSIQVDSGVLSENDSLSARYVAEQDLNSPETWFSAQDAFAVYGQPSETNTLSLGIQMAFENGAPLVVGIMAKPPVPRKTSEYLINPNNTLTSATEGASGGFDVRDTIFPLGVGALPDIDGKVNVFVVSDDGTEEQILLNKVDFYDTDITTVAQAYSDFVMGPLGESYTVFTAPEVEQEGDDGYLRAATATDNIDDPTGLYYFRSPSAQFAADRLATGEGDVGKTLVLLGSSDAPSEFSTVFGSYEIVSVGDGYGNLNVAILDPISPTDPSALLAIYPEIDGYQWQIVDPNDTDHAYFAITDDFAANYLTEGKGLRVSYVDTADADYFDTNWGEAVDALETVDAQIIVPLPLNTVSNIFQVFKRHVEVESNIINQHERVLVVGAIPGLEPDHLIGVAQAAVEDVGLLEGIQGDDVEEVLAGNIEDLTNYSVPDGFGDSFRVIYTYPDEVIRNIAGQNTTIPGYFVAAALGGFLAGQVAIQNPCTFQTLAGFNIPNTKKLRRRTKNQLGGAGVLVIEPIAGGGRMLWGKTTVSSGAPEEEEISIVFIRDQVARTVRASLRPFIGRVQSATIVPELSAGIGKLMRSMVGQGLLAGFGSITVQRNPIEPRQIDITVSIAPVSPVNWIYVNITVEL